MNWNRSFLEWTKLRNEGEKETKQPIIHSSIRPVLVLGVKPLTVTARLVNQPNPQSTKTNKLSAHHFLTSRSSCLLVSISLFLPLDFYTLFHRPRYHFFLFSHFLSQCDARLQETREEVSKKWTNLFLKSLPLYTILYHPNELDVTGAKLAPPCTDWHSDDETERNMSTWSLPCAVQQRCSNIPACWIPWPTDRCPPSTRAHEYRSCQLHCSGRKEKSLHLHAASEGSRNNWPPGRTELP
jgi:hypothetical protein